MSYDRLLNEAMDTGEVAFVYVGNQDGRLAVTFDILEKHKLDNGANISMEKMRAIITIHERELQNLQHNLKQLYG